MALDVRLQMVLDQATVDQLDQLRRQLPDLPSRSELIRRLIQHAAATAAAPQKRQRG